MYKLPKKGTTIALLQIFLEFLLRQLHVLLNQLTLYTQTLETTRLRNVLGGTTNHQTH